jgi:hypothetical protein
VLVVRYLGNANFITPQKPLRKRAENGFFRVVDFWSLFLEDKALIDFLMLINFIQ